MWFYLTRSLRVTLPLEKPSSTVMTPSRLLSYANFSNFLISSVSDSIAFIIVTCQWLGQLIILWINLWTIFSCLRQAHQPIDIKANNLRMICRIPADSRQQELTHPVRSILANHPAISFRKSRGSSFVRSVHSTWHCAERKSKEGYRRTKEGESWKFRELCSNSSRSPRLLRSVRQR